ncbi:9421_t:CDS:2 [Racocetra fulgida]|uniref:9421_t:CDS:1 n=1 Tax=Racocetra fulgida TaxID=60492 RepID=A0A9N8YR71_9GLOM|nr:9421_t:CDS:2 [Racocetra fulgida]
MSIQKIIFTKNGEIDAVQKLTGKELNNKGIKLVVPFELSLNGEKRQIETIEFFCNANSAINFFLTNALSNNGESKREHEKIRQNWDTRDLEVKNKKPTIIKNAVLSTKSFLSIKDGNILYIIDTDRNERAIKGLMKEKWVEIIFTEDISEKEKFIKRYPKEEPKDMKKEIETAIRALENGENVPDNTVPPEPVPRQNNPDQKASPNQIPRKIIILA